MTTNIPPRERDAAVQALRAGVVPRLGIRHVQVGRAREVEETVLDMTRIAQGGSAVRFVIGEYGSGKTFFLTLARNVAAEKKLVVMHDRPVAGAPPACLRRPGPDAVRRARAQHVNAHEAGRRSAGKRARTLPRRGPEGGGPQKGATRGDVIRDRLEAVREGVAGFDFAEVVVRYWQAFEQGNETIKAAALRWLRAEIHSQDRGPRGAGRARHC